MHIGKTTKTLYDLRFERLGSPDVEVARTVQIEHGARVIQLPGASWMDGSPVVFQLNDSSAIDSRPLLSNRPKEHCPGLHPESITLDHENSRYSGEDATTIFYPITPDGKVDVIGDGGQVHTLQLRFLRLTGERAIEQELACPFPAADLDAVTQEAVAGENGTTRHLRLVA